MKLKTIIVISSLIIMAGCKADSEVEETATTNDKEKTDVKQDLNISFLLDLSDRISPTKYPNQSMEYYKRDVGYINTTAKVFDNHIRQKRMVQANDKIQLFFDPEPSNPEINNIANSLKFNVNRSNISKELLNNIKSKYETQPIKIYELAIKDGEKSGDYNGSRTWSFFKNKLKDNCIEQNHRNILIVLSDGYLYHKDNIINDNNKTSYLTSAYIQAKGLNTSNWQEKMEKEGFGFIPVSPDLSNIEILVLGINPSAKNPYELDVIEKYWQDWFKAMNVKRFEIKTANLPSDMENIIKKFIAS